MGVGGMYLNQVKYLLRIFQSSWVTRGERVHRQLINSETVYVNNFYVKLDNAFSIHEPIKPTVLTVPHFIDQKVDPMAGHFGKTAVAISGAMRG